MSGQGYDDEEGGNEQGRGRQQNRPGLMRRFTHQHMVARCIGWLTHGHHGRGYYMQNGRAVKMQAWKAHQQGLQRRRHRGYQPAGPRGGAGRQQGGGGGDYDD